jgi:hypothetical protein
MKVCGGGWSKTPHIPDSRNKLIEVVKFQNPATLRPDEQPMMRIG